jgi:hypothetical protein
MEPDSSFAKTRIISYVGDEVLTAVVMKNSTFWDKI